MMRSEVILFFYLSKRKQKRKEPGVEMKVSAVGAKKEERNEW
jgi:hypothetical protein